MYKWALCLLIVSLLAPIRALAGEYIFTIRYRNTLTSPWGYCTAFAVRNKPSRVDDLVVTAAHCVDNIIQAETGDTLVPRLVGKVASVHDIAILQGSLSENIEQLPIASHLPPKASLFYFVGFNAPFFGTALGKPEPLQEDSAWAGSWELIAGVKPGNSGGPLLWQGPGGKLWAVGVTFGYNQRGKGFFVPLSVLQRFVRASW